ncbi:uncharacterized protein LOC117319318 [Pecten maximus]|uniref:uncharacterized protein LOC117319318 n=2 Tax=Pecten maximus TaxID=6579 RepID=UPI001457FBC3|nr:uncharacterized protein LOC117319318 [Pecten maximus]
MEMMQGWIDLGTKLGLEDEALQDFVKEQQDREREERAAVREELRLKEERELKLMELTVQEKTEAVRLQTMARGREEGKARLGRYNPKLPPFDETKDDLDSYLRRFETFVLAQGWDEENWAVALSTLLKGKALEVFSRLSPETALHYRLLKEALLKRFDYTEDGFRKKFRESRVDDRETFSQFAVRLENYFTRWLDMAKCSKTYDALKDLVIREQLLMLCQKELVIFLKERKPDSIEQLSLLADQFMEARRQPAKNFMVRNSPFSKPVTQHTSNANGGPNRSSGNPSTGNRNTNPTYTDTRKCFNCQGIGHIAAKCPNRGTKGKSMAIQSPEPSLPVKSGLLGDCKVSVLRDTGCSGIVVRSNLVGKSQYLGYNKTCKLADGTELTLPVAEVYICSPFFTGKAEVWLMENPVYDVLIGNVQGAKEPDIPDVVAAVQTRAQIREQQQGTKPLKVPPLLKEVASRTDMIQAQMDDQSLKNLHDLARQGKIKETPNGNVSCFTYRKGLLYRKIEKLGEITHQVVVPSPFREAVLQLAHDGIMAGHMGIKRTTERVMSGFFWPGCKIDVSRYCKSCDICQRTIQKGRVNKAPLGEMPIIGQAFERVAVDLIGPLIPASDRGHRYILTLVDFATRYPEAVPLKKIDTESVADALLDIFSRVGVPREILSDRGGQFTSEMMAEVSRLLSMKQLVTTPYHPACNGLVERYNGTLKSMLKRMCTERPKDWDRYVSPLLFAYREVPQESLGFAPFELLFGRTIRGPMEILRELWTKDVDNSETKTTYQYVLDLKEKLEETCQLARENLTRARRVQKKQYDRNARRKDLGEGDKVLVLLPTKSNKLELQWKGPFQVVKATNLDYKIDMGNKIKTFHANMLQKYVERETAQTTYSRQQEKGILASVSLSVVEETSEEVYPIPMPGIESSESVEDCHVSETLEDTAQQQMRSLLQEFSDVMTDLPGCTPLTKHDIRTTTDQPVRVKPYPVPYQVTETIKRELHKMLEMDIIEKSDSDYSSPVVLVRKKDGTCRFCVDYRQLNKITIFDAEPMPSTEDLFVKLARCKYLSKIDLSKGYWQVPMTDQAKRRSAFTTPMGLYQFKVMSFGLVNAPATFSRLMRKVLEGMNDLDNFLDDILVFTVTWEEHLESLHSLLQRLRDSKLTARPTKCFFGYEELECLGHMVGQGTLRPVAEKLDSIQRAPVPSTKRQVRSFIGLASYYRKFIPNFAAIAVPLTDLTKKGMPNKVIWEVAQEEAFNTLKELLMSEPVLRLPDLDKEFTLRTDASDLGLGAILLQECDGKFHPIAYASRKLLPRERRYAVMEKECLALVWGVMKFQRYLLGKEFCVETDHQPLTCLSKSKVANARIMRWAMLLQPFRMRIKAIPGRDNVGADFLSRAMNE